MISAGLASAPLQCPGGLMLHENQCRKLLRLLAFVLADTKHGEGGL
jgi:hypothetical protein